MEKDYKKYVKDSCPNCQYWNKFARQAFKCYTPFHCPAWMKDHKM